MAAPPALLTNGDLARRTACRCPRSASTRRAAWCGRSAPTATSAGSRAPISAACALIAQTLGLSLGEIQTELASLPQGRTPTRAWQAISARMRCALDARITRLIETRDRLDGCIGCGCLSLDRCALYNPGDRAARAGPGRGRGSCSATGRRTSRGNRRWRQASAGGHFFSRIQGRLDQVPSKSVRLV
jgi:MerR family redox-sensitive transcriptional activator SoxR